VKSKLPLCAPENPSKAAKKIQRKVHSLLDRATRCLPLSLDMQGQKVDGVLHPGEKPGWEEEMPLRKALTGPALPWTAWEVGGRRGG
jgi:hypothetical protein